MNKINIAFACLMLICLNACVSKSSKITAPVISFSDRGDNDFESIEISFLKLETTKDNLIGSIDQIQNYGNNIFILDYSQEGGLYEFDRSGGYKAKIGDMGRGYGEYIAPGSFSIDSTNHRIIIIDDETGKMLSYDLSNREFIETTKMPVNGSYFEKMCGNNSLWKIFEYENGDIANYDYALLDSDNKVSKKFLKKIIKSAIITGPSKMVYKLNDTVRFYRQFDPYLYKLGEDGELEGSYCFEIENAQFPPQKFIQKISTNHGDYYHDLINSNYISYHDISETVHDISILYMTNGTKYLGVYNKLTGETVCGSWEQVEEGIGIKGLTYVAGTIGDYIVIPLFVEQLKDHQKAGFVYPEELSDIMANTGEGENPILLLFKFK